MLNLTSPWKEIVLDLDSFAYSVEMPVLISAAIAKASTAFGKLEKREYGQIVVLQQTPNSACICNEPCVFQSCYMDLKHGQLITGIMLTYSKGFINIASAES